VDGECEAAEEPGGCEGDAECGEGHVCQDGECRALCGEDGDCADGMECHEGSCRERGGGGGREPGAFVLENRSILGNTNDRGGETDGQCDLDERTTFVIDRWQHADDLNSFGARFLRADRDDAGELGEPAPLGAAPIEFQEDSTSRPAVVGLGGAALCPGCLAGVVVDAECPGGDDHHCLVFLDLRNGADRYDFHDGSALHFDLWTPAGGEDPPAQIPPELWFSPDGSITCVLVADTLRPQRCHVSCFDLLEDEVLHDGSYATPCLFSAEVTDDQRLRITVGGVEESVGLD